MENADLVSGPFDLFAGLGTLDDLAAPRGRPLVHRDGAGSAGMSAAAASNGDAMSNTAPLQAQPLTVAGPIAAAAPANAALSEEIAALSSGLIHAAGPSSPTLVTPNPVAPDVHPSLGGSAGAGQANPGSGGGGPLDVLNPFLETLQVPTESVAGVTSHAVLERGVTYTLYAWGDFQYGATTADRGDAQYRKFTSPTPYSGDGVSHIGVTLSGVMVVGGYPVWGSYSAQHRYRLRVVGMGAPLHAFYLDTPGSYGTHHGSLSLALDPPSTDRCGPPDTPPVQCCGQNGDLSQTAQGSDGSYDSARGYGEGGIRYFDLENRAESDVLSSDGFGTDWGVSLTDADWSNSPRCTGMLANMMSLDLGTGVSDSEQPYILDESSTQSNPPTTVVVMTSSTAAHYFDYDSVNHVYLAHEYRQDRLVLSGNTFIYSDTTGRNILFNDFTHSQQSSSPPGQFMSQVDRAGHQTNATYDGNGRLMAVSRTGPNGGSNTLTETYKFSYNPDFTVAQVALNRHTNSNPDTTVRQVMFSYYANGQTGGNAGTLKLAEVQERNSQGDMTTFDTYYYRYDANNYLTMVFKPQSYARLLQNVPNALNQLDPTVQPYADYVFTRGAGSISVTVQGEGCSSCTGGQGTFSYVKQTPLMTFSNAYNHWHYETIETLPDNSTRTVFANYVGETMLSVFQSGGQTWETFYKYEEGPTIEGYGRTLWVAHPSAILYNAQGQGYDPNSADLMVADQNGHYTFLKDNQGLVTVYDYYADSNGSGENIPGHALGYLADVKLQMGQAPSGQMPSPITRTTYQYYQHAATSNGLTVYPLATQTDYQNDNGTGAELTQYSYTWLLDAGGHPTAQPQTLTVQKPLIPTSQNGPGGTSYDVTTTTFDPYGRVIQTVDPDNKVVSYTYDQATGAVTQMVQDAGGLSQVNLSGAFTTGRVGIATDGMSFSGVGLDGSGDAYSATFAPNGAVTWNTRTFTLGPANQADVVVAAGQTITLPATAASSLSLLATAVGGGTGQPNQNFTVTYNDGSTQTFSRSLSDWLAPQNYPGEAPALTMPYYNTATGGRVNQTATVYGYSFALNPAKPVQSLTLPSNSHVVLLAASLTNLDLTTTYTVDPFGRDASIQRPNGTAQFPDSSVSLTEVVYNDFTHETRTYPGWHFNSTTSTWQTTGPTQLTREDRSTTTVYYETLTMSAPPHVTGNQPDGTEAIGQVQSLSRDLTDNSGQVIEHDAYVDVGPGYSYSATIAGAHYNATISGFDVRGRKNKTVSANATIQRTVYDGLSRAVSVWIGTNDAGATDSDPTGNHTAGNNMIQVSGNVYDGGGIGDNTLTQTTQYPHGTTDTANPPRVTNMYYDWRDRRVYTWEGYQSPQDTTTHRPIIYLTFDNLDEVTGTKRFDGDTVTTVSFQNGVPQQPMSSLLRATTGTHYDYQGRVYETDTYRVATDGTILLTPLATDNWYNHRGLLVKTSAPGGLVQKMSYDGAGRETFVFTTDGAGDNGPNTAQGWSDAQQVNGSNNVLTQTQAQYDGDDNVVFQTTWDRYHNSTYGGDLSLAPTQQARVSFTGKFYDAADRLTNDVNYGNNGNTFLATRPTTITARGADAALKTDYSYLADTVQTVALSGNPTGAFKLSFNGTQLTDNIPVSATAALVQSRLQGLTTIGMNNVLVYGPAGGPWNVRFTGTLAGQDEPLLVADGSGLTGGSVSVARASQGGDSGRVQATTDPRGLVAKTDYDLLGRTLRTVAAFTNNAAFMDPNWNQVTEYAYDGDNHVTLLTAYPGDGSIEQTQYTYTANPADSSWISSNDQLTLVQYPDQSSGRPSTHLSDQETYLYDNLGETRSMTQRTGTVHNYAYDVLGRSTQDSVGSFGTGVDQTVGALATAYDTYGNAATFTSYAPNGTTIVNQVQRTYNGFGQLTAETQYHGDPGNPNTPHGTVSYTYSTPAVGMNYSRLTRMTYPNGRQLDYSYGGGSDTLDNSISRLTTITDHGSAIVLETHIDGTNAYSDYLGLGTLVQRDHPEPNLTLTYVGGTSDANDPYGGLDRFGRVVDQKWQGPSGSTDNFQYGYDYNGNRLYRANLVTEGMPPLAFDELYHASGSVDTYNAQGQLQSEGYDVLNQTTCSTR
jgi:YD repeat-containing protein